MPIRHDALAKIYAKSLFELAEEAGGQPKLEEINDELEQLCELIRSQPAFGEFIRSPIIDVKARGATLHNIFDGRVTDLTLRFLLVLNDKGRLNRLASIADAYDHLLQEAFGRIEVDVYTAGPLGDEALESIKQRITAALRKEPVLHSYTDPTMIGGVKLQIGDQLIDGSLSNRLRRLKSDLLGAGAWKVRERFSDIIQE